MRIRILHDSDNVYPDGMEMDAADLISDYKDGLTTDPNDVEFAEWLSNVSEESAVQEICNLWVISYETIE